MWGRLHVLSSCVSVTQNISEDCQNVVDNEHPLSSRTEENVKKIRQMNRENHQPSVQMIAEAEH